MKKIILLILIVIAAESEVYAQCGCGAGAAVGGLTPAAGTANVGVLRERNIRAFVYYTHSRGDTYYTYDMQKGAGDAESFQSDYIGINAGYGISRRFTAEAEFGYFINKSQKIFGSETMGRGPSHISLIGKYNFFYDFENSIEITAGAGVRMPLPDNSENLAMHVRPSSGAFGGILHIFLYKGFEDAGVSLFFLSRTELNTENEDAYKYGHSSVNSIFLVKPLLENLTGAVEIRNEYRRKDLENGNKVCDSGGNMVIISPQVNISAGRWNFAAIYGYPLYSFYNGTQLARDMSFTFSVSFETD